MGFQSCALTRFPRYRADTKPGFTIHTLKPAAADPRVFSGRAVYTAQASVARPSNALRAMGKRRIWLAGAGTLGGRTYGGRVLADLLVRRALGQRRLWMR